MSCGSLPRQSVSSGRAAACGRAGGASRLSAGESGHHFLGFFRFAGRTGKLLFFVTGSEQNLKFMAAFFASEFIDRHIPVSIIVL